MVSLVGRDQECACEGISAWEKKKPKKKTPESHKAVSPCGQFVVDDSAVCDDFTQTQLQVHFSLRDTDGGFEFRCAGRTRQTPPVCAGCVAQSHKTRRLI